MDTIINKLQAFLHASKPLLLVLGEAGSGKHNLFARFATTLDNSQQLLRINAKRKLKPARLSTMMCAQWHIALSSAGENNRQQLEWVLAEIQQRAKPCLLVIEDAHQLPYATLAAITLLAISQKSENTYLHLILMGQPILADRIDSLIAPANREALPQVLYIKTGAQQKAPQPFKELKQRFIDMPIRWPKLWRQHRVKAAAALLLAVGFFGFVKAVHQQQVSKPQRIAIVLPHNIRPSHKAHHA